MIGGIILKWINGYLVCCSQKGSWERFMNMCRHHKIALWNIKKMENVSFCIKASDFKKLLPFIHKTKVSIHIQRKKGFPFFLFWCKKNITFCAGLIFFFVLLKIFSAYVWEISFQGQSNYTKETLQKAVNEMGITRGTKRSRLICDDIEKGLRKKYTNISWVSAEEKGSRLVISIKETVKTVKRTSEEKPCHIISPCNGVVQTIAVNRGIAMVKKGERVKKGQILISGVLPITDDSDTIIEKKAVSAKGTVILMVNQTVRSVIRGEIKEKEYTGKRIVCWQWNVGKHSFSIKNPFKRFHNSFDYDIITTVKFDKKIQPLLNQNIRLERYEYREYRWKSVRRTKKQIQSAANEYRIRFRRKIEEEGTYVGHSLHVQKENETDYLLLGTITYTKECKETRMIQKKECQVERKAEDEKNEQS